MKGNDDGSDPPRTTTAQRRAAPPQPSGWTTFAAVMLIIAGALDALWGLAAVLNDEVVTVGGRGVIVWDFTAWGWFHLILGAILLVTAWGVATMQSWARWTAVGFATLSAITQVGVLPAFPLWALIVIALDVIIIYGLTARWDQRP